MRLAAPQMRLAAYLDAYETSSLRPEP